MYGETDIVEDSLPSEGPPDVAEHVLMGQNDPGVALLKPAGHGHDGSHTCASLCKRYQPHTTADDLRPIGWAKAADWSLTGP